MAAGENTYFDNDGKSVHVTLSYETDALAVAYVEGFLGIAATGGASGDTIALNIDRRAYQFTVPSTLDVSKGDTVYIEIAEVDVDHHPPDDSYSTTAGSGKVALFKAIEDKDDNNVVVGILLPEGV
jgi:plastocyanin